MRPGGDLDEAAAQLVLVARQLGVDESAARDALTRAWHPTPEVPAGPHS